MKRALNIAAVLPRYGKSLGGGAETLVGELVREIASRSRIGERTVDRVEVWTTCAKDHRTWANELSEGETSEDGILVHRFPVDERDLEVFLRHEIAIAEGKNLSCEDQLAWLSQSVNSRGLYEHILRNGPEFDAILFAPYLFATTFWGGLIHPDRSFLVPCLHDEGYAYQDVFGYLLSSVRGILFNAQAEQRLADHIYQISRLDRKSEVVGMGFVESEKAEMLDAVRSSPYILYSGRKEQGKNLDLLIEYFQWYRELYSDDELELVIIGAGEISFLESLPEGVVDLGFVAEEEKLALMRHAQCLVQPSVNESFSIVLMESWLQEVPVVVHGDCAVTREHVERSSGGLYFTNHEEFAGVINSLRNDSNLREELGNRGREYVAREYSWSAVLQRFGRLLDKTNVAGADDASLGGAV